MTYYIAVEDGEMGTHHLIGPFDDQPAAEDHATKVVRTLRLQAFEKYEGEYHHPDDASWFTWVVEVHPVADSVYSPETGTNVPLIEDYPPPYQEN